LLPGKPETPFWSPLGLWFSGIVEPDGATAGPDLPPGRPGVPAWELWLRPAAGSAGAADFVPVCDHAGSAAAAIAAITAARNSIFIGRGSWFVIRRMCGSSGKPAGRQPGSADDRWAAADMRPADAEQLSIPRC
jgi:hypothetical protein